VALAPGWWAQSRSGRQRAPGGSGGSGRLGAGGSGGSGRPGAGEPGAAAPTGGKRRLRQARRGQVRGQGRAGARAWVSAPVAPARARRAPASGHGSHRGRCGGGGSVGDEGEIFLK
jgi:hypothetical protein